MRRRSSFWAATIWLVLSLLRNYKMMSDPLPRARAHTPAAAAAAAVRPAVLGLPCLWGGCRRVRARLPPLLPPPRPSHQEKEFLF